MKRHIHLRKARVLPPALILLSSCTGYGGGETPAFRLDWTACPEIPSGISALVYDASGQIQRVEVLSDPREVVLPDAYPGSGGGIIFHSYSSSEWKSLELKGLDSISTARAALCASGAAPLNPLCAGLAPKHGGPVPMNCLTPRLEIFFSLEDGGGFAAISATIGNAVTSRPLIYGSSPIQTGRLTVDRGWSLIGNELRCSTLCLGFPDKWDGPVTLRLTAARGSPADTSFTIGHCPLTRRGDCYILDLSDVPIKLPPTGTTAGGFEAGVDEWKDEGTIDIII